jgi:Arc/MetJ-type ribon-helix-helix transcriptional regulator
LLVIEKGLLRLEAAKFRVTGPLSAEPKPASCPRFWHTMKVGAAAMENQLTADQKAFARRAIETGRLHSEEEAVQEALALWEERERGRLEFLATLDDARASLAAGEGRAITQQSMRELAAEVTERGRARLIAELAGSR